MHVSLGASLSERRRLPKAAWWSLDRWRELQGTSTAFNINATAKLMTMILTILATRIVPDMDAGAIILSGCAAHRSEAPLGAVAYVGEDANWAIMTACYSLFAHPELLDGPRFRLLLPSDHGFHAEKAITLREPQVKRLSGESLAKIRITGAAHARSRSRSSHPRQVRRSRERHCDRLAGRAQRPPASSTSTTAIVY